MEEGRRRRCAARRWLRAVSNTLDGGDVLLFLVIQSPALLRHTQTDRHTPTLETPTSTRALLHTRHTARTQPPPEGESLSSIGPPIAQEDSQSAQTHHGAHLCLHHGPVGQEDPGGAVHQLGRCVSFFLFSRLTSKTVQEAVGANRAARPAPSIRHSGARAAIPHLRAPSNTAHHQTTGHRRRAQGQVCGGQARLLPVAPALLAAAKGGREARRGAERQRQAERLRAQDGRDAPVQGPRAAGA